MKIKSRYSSSGFIELNVDEIECTIFKNEKEEATDLINNLISIINDLTAITGRDISDHINDFF